jgi:WD40 repeat protein
LIKAGRTIDALPYLARSLRIRRQNNQAAALAFGYLSITPVARIIFQHQNELTSATFSPDGTRVGTSSVDDSARVWNTLTGQPVTPPLKHQSVVNNISFSLDGSRVLTSSTDTTARLWDATTGQPIAPPIVGAIVPDALGDVNAIFSPDGTRVLTSLKNVARVWNGQTGEAVSPLLEHEGSICVALFSPDGSRVLTASVDQTACLWDATTGNLLTPPLQHKGQVVWAVFSPDGKEVATTSSEKITRVWDVATGRPVTPSLQDRGSQAVAFSPDGKILLIVAENAAYLFDPKNNKLAVPALQNQAAIDSAAFSSDGKEVVTVSKNKIARIWDVATGQTAGSPISLQPDTVPPLANVQGQFSLSNTAALPNLASFSPNGNALVIICDNTARVWNAKTGEPITLPFRHQGSILSARFSPNGSSVLTCSRDFTARLWSPRAGQLISLALPQPYTSSSARFSADGTRILAASWNDTEAIWGVWDLQTGRAVFPPVHHQGAISSAAFSPDEAAILTTSSSAPKSSFAGTKITINTITESSKFTAQVWNAKTGEAVTPPIEHGRPITSFSFSPDGRFAATASWLDHTSKIWDAKTGRILFPPLQPENAVSFSPDGTRLVTVSYGQNARIWDIRTGGSLLPPLSHPDRVIAASFSPDGTQIITASDDRMARIWDAHTGRLVSPPLAHQTSVEAITFSPDGRRVATSAGKFAYIWDVKTGHLACPALSAEDYVESVVFSPDGTRLATCSNTDVRLWETETGQIIFPPLAGESSPSFSPDGNRLMTVSEDGVKIWDLAPSGTCPEWLPDVLDASALQFLNDVDSVQQFSVDEFNQIRQERLASVSTDPWEVFGRWLFSDPENRTLSPWATETVSDYVQRLTAEGTKRSLDRADALSTDHPDWLEQIKRKRAGIPLATPVGSDQ